MSNVVEPTLVDGLSNTSISGTTKRARAGMLELLILFSISRTSAQSTLGIPKNLNLTTKLSRSIFQYPRLHFRHRIICLRHRFPHQLLSHHSMSASRCLCTSCQMAQSISYFHHRLKILWSSHLLRRRVTLTLVLLDTAGRSEHC